MKKVVVTGGAGFIGSNLAEELAKKEEVFIIDNLSTGRIENIQRDLNIALMNELTIIFYKIGLDTKAVLDAASTKWNFYRYNPGLVGGHCIPVDPYYLVYKAKELDYHPQVILARRAINDYMPKHVTEITIKALIDSEKVIKGSKVLIMGLTYKENGPDTRETPVKAMIKELKSYGIRIFGYNPLLAKEKINEFEITTVEHIIDVKFDCVIITVIHNALKDITLDKLKEMMNNNPVLIDLKGIFNKQEAKIKGFYYKTL